MMVGVVLVLSILIACILSIIVLLITSRTLIDGVLPIVEIFKVESSLKRMDEQIKKGEK